MDINLVKEIVSMMENSKLSSMEIELKDMRIKLEKNVDTNTLQTSKKASPVEAKHYEAVTSSEVEVITAEAPKTIEDSSAEYVTIKAPMVGTFYAAPSPDSEPFVTVGKTVKKGDIVCIIEAMKLMNEIESECSGTVAEVMVKEGDMVEYGQPLFKIKK